MNRPCGTGVTQGHQIPLELMGFLNPSELANVDFPGDEISESFLSLEFDRADKARVCPCPIAPRRSFDRGGKGRVRCLRSCRKSSGVAPIEGSFRAARRKSDPTAPVKVPDARVVRRFQADRIVARQQFGKAVLNNLAYSCVHCNQHKGPNPAGADPEPSNSLASSIPAGYLERTFSPGWNNLDRAHADWTCHRRCHGDQ